ncbi:hypothetical protein [Trichormus variabilis]|uniref:Uncharacterized protein n=1 Tax=Trichormus variabilis SAG 1403-4b TaxID=447716 RepID=A0A3S1CB02_ANAVA|nr:hypothetical protein [Trichormus variabilis]MBD2625990.1 hypothetical protein [Trichormus variabilis FACHB-164]RUS98394.1 hypothetical protein DSM107003_14820 [Trichormus variabilis SAG 1403-4b]
MQAIKRLFNQLSRHISLLILAGLIWLMGLPMLSVHADGFYSEKTHKTEMNKPFYSTKQRRIATNEPFKPYYSTQERHKQKVYTTPATEEDYIESGKRAGEVIPKDLGTGSRQKNPINMLKRAGEELGNEPLKRSFGAKDYERSEIEQELARNKAARGDS